MKLIVELDWMATVTVYINVNAYSIAEKFPENFLIEMHDYLGPFIEVEISRMRCRNGRSLPQVWLFLEHKNSC
jgi:hypothetical protein